MSQHPSLLGSQKGRQHRSVFKRYEKLKHLIEKEKWEKEVNSIYSLPKIKSIRFKAKKEKAAAPETAEATAATAQAGVAPAPGAPIKPGQAQQTAAAKPVPKDKKAKA